MVNGKKVIMGKYGISISLALALSCLTQTSVYANERVMTGILAPEEDTIVLLGESETYEVQKGDNLWKIAEHLFGDGSKYKEILAQNWELVKNPNLIYPGTTLQITKGRTLSESALYYQDIGSPREEYTFNIPAWWTVGVVGNSDRGANYVWCAGDGSREGILCLIRDKEPVLENTLADWNHVQESIRSYVEKEYGDKVHYLTFENYHTQNGEEVYFYTYQHTVDLAEFDVDKGGTVDVAVCVGIKLTQGISAQFIGYATGFTSSDILYFGATDAYSYIGDTAFISNQVRYTTAGFEQTVAGENLDIDGNNMKIWPDYPWDLEGLYNPFPWVYDFAGSIVAWELE